MSNLHDRAKILEDLFFSQLDAQLLRQRRSDLEHAELIEQLHQLFLELPLREQHP